MRLQVKLFKYGPKGSLSPTLGDPCSICKRPLSVGDYTTLVNRTGATRYANDGTEVHWDCAAQIDAAALERDGTP